MQDVTIDHERFADLSVDFIAVHLLAMLATSLKLWQISQWTFSYPRKQPLRDPVTSTAIYGRLLPHWVIDSYSCDLPAFGILHWNENCVLGWSLPAARTPTD